MLLRSGAETGISTGEERALKGLSSRQCHTKLVPVIRSAVKSSLTFLPNRRLRGPDVRGLRGFRPMRGTRPISRRDAGERGRPTPGLQFLQATLEVSSTPDASRNQSASRGLIGSLCVAAPARNPNRLRRPPKHLSQGRRQVNIQSGSSHGGCPLVEFNVGDVRVMNGDLIRLRDFVFGNVKLDAVWVEGNAAASHQYARDSSGQAA
jgi:hypothetical protein